MSDLPQKHIVAFAYSAWGHARPMAILLTRFLRLHPVQVTFFMHDGFYDRLNNELARNFKPGEEELAKRIRTITVGPALGMISSPDTDENFKEAWAKLVAQEPVTCRKTGTVFSGLPKPSVVIIDMFAVLPFKHIRDVSGESIKLIMWHSGATSEMFWFWAPEKFGGRGNLRLKVEAEAARSGTSFAEAATKITWGKGTTGDVVRIAGFPPMYDYEYFPQEFDLPDEVLIHVFPYVHEWFQAADGVLMYSTESFEPEPIAAVRTWFGETNRPAYVCGPLFPSGAEASKTEKTQSAEAEEIEALLDNSLKTLGKHSVLYISLGTIFWPAHHPERLWAILDAAMELGVPFILARASPFAAVPDDVLERVKAYGKGIISPWTPQQMILDHPATGWFVSHGGHNSVMEAIHAGVPQIIWPFIADQPLNAIQLAETLQTGYELIEVRSGLGLKPIYRNGKTPTGTFEAIKAEVREVLTKAFGEDGAQRRERLLALRERVHREWDEGGATHRDVTTFLKSL